MVKSVLVLGMALASMAANASASSFHGYQHNHRKDVKPFGPSARSGVHHTVYSTPVQVQPLRFGKRNLRASRLSGGVEDAELEDAVSIAASYLSEHHDIPEDNMKLKSAYRSEHTGVTHVYFRQVVNGLEVVNGNANVNIDKNGRIISSGNSFSSSYTVSKPSTESEHTWTEAAEAAIKGSWETAHELVSSAFDELVSEVTDGVDKVMEMVDGITGRLRIQDADSYGDEAVIDLIGARARNRPHNGKARQHAFSTRDVKSSYISVKEALKRLSHHLKDDLLPHQLSKVDIDASTNLDGEPEIALNGLPSSFAVDGKVSAQAALLRLDDGSLVETWDMTVEQDDHWWNAQINARTGKVDALVDWSNNYVAEPEAYRVYPWQVPDPSLGERVLIENPSDPKASPKGWSRHNQTSGNNVFAQSNPDGGYQWQHNFRPTSAERVFDYGLDLKSQPSSYIEAAITQLFYTNNFMHDLFYHYGFDEASGNFQDENFSGKGKGNDAVIANAQDGSGYNNANFATPPDGRHPKMRMYVWDLTQPYRDGDLEQGIVVHEYTHGISIRLTGGPANSNCLSYGESGGMGEGWGDIFATIIRLTADSTRDDDIPMGAYSANRGIRKYPYSTSLKTNPSTYGIMNGPAYWEVHAKGEVWAEIYYEVLWNLIDAHGFSDDLFSHDMTKGNTLALQLLVDGMKLQPCMPNFIDARDAILLADRQLTGGDNQCLIWKGFAKRGLGVDAELLFDSPWGGGSRTEDFKVPDECK
ncbi:hypothetical protein GGF40_002552 [Coemansia sp. RSA 1286]|nr:hypothetical protein IWW45_007408 [Coemansia sp. RSA 485]KAJ2598045.1 hypothetical protein GGF39_002800 [Coemansia sp. RSA 1721]KAJ2637167.1 hypothetical protein GGF40_002552 [Coemansia sp. RSA 1286]